jgi:hypothetical protein
MDIVRTEEGNEIVEPAQPIGGKHRKLLHQFTSPGPGHRCAYTHIIIRHIQRVSASKRLKFPLKQMAVTFAVNSLQQAVCNKKEPWKILLLTQPGRSNPISAALGRSFSQFQENSLPGREPEPLLWIERRE